MTTRAVLTAQKVNGRLERLMPVITPAGVLLGFFLPGIFIHLRPFVPWLFGLMTLSGALKLKVSEFGGTLREPLPIAAFFVVSHIVMPLCSFLTAMALFPGNSDVIAGFILLFSGPSAVSAFIWVTMFRGDKALCLTLILLDTVLAPVLVPGTVSVLAGAKTVMDIHGIAVSLVLMVVVPTIIGVTVNETTRGKIPDMICPFLNPLAKICLMLVVAANTSAAAGVINIRQPLVWKIAALSIVLSAAAFVISKLAAAAVKTGKEKSVTVLFSGSLRNISAVTTIAVSFFPEAAALPALLGIMFQQTIAAVMGRIFSGKTERKGQPPIAPR